MHDAWRKVAPRACGTYVWAASPMGKGVFVMLRLFGRQTLFFGRRVGVYGEMCRDSCGCTINPSPPIQTPHPPGPE